MADDPPILILARPRGRPPAPEPRASLSTWLPASDADLLIKLARKRDQTVSAFLRGILVQAIRVNRT